MPPSAFADGTRHRSWGSTRLGGATRVIPSAIRPISWRGTEIVIDAAALTPADPLASPDVRVVRSGAREFVLVGTAHVSRESTQLVREVIEAAQPDGVCIELDAGRYDALSKPQRFEQLDLRQVMRSRQLPTLFANLLLAAFQHSLGVRLGVRPGAELLEGARAAEAIGKPFHLCDREVRITLRRAWHALSLWKKAMLVAALAESLVSRPEMSEDDLRELRERDVMSQLLTELATAFPGLKAVLIDERDAYLAERIRQAPGAKLVAVVGAGHVAGLAAHLERAQPIALAPLEVVPQPSRWLGVIGWGVPLAILASLVWVGVREGLQAAGDSALGWILATGTPTAIGALAAFAHPATIVSAFLAAPITTLLPFVGAGHVTAFVQSYFRPPLVRELANVLDDLGSLAGLWRNRLLRILLVFVMTSLGGSLGMWFGISRIVGRAVAGG
jgi:pheromone shutdown-related protein TraB